MLCNEVYDYFIANRSKLSDPVWLAAFLKPHCKLKRMGWRGSRLRIIQVPSEFAQFLILLAAENVTKYLEIGTSTGGSFMMVDSYLRAAVPGFIQSVGYDRTSKLRDWGLYKATFPDTEFRHEGSGSMNLKGERFDAAFIDARHVEKWVLHDFEKVKSNCKLVAFHDIVLEGSSVGLAWNRIKSDRTNWEFIDSEIPVNARCGIGVVRV